MRVNPLDGGLASQERFRTRVSKNDVTPQGVRDMGANAGEWTATAGAGEPE